MCDKLHVFSFVDQLLHSSCRSLKVQIQEEYHTALEKGQVYQQEKLPQQGLSQAQVPEVEQKLAAVELQVREEVAVKCVSNDCSDSSSRSKIAACVLVPKKFQTLTSQLRHKEWKPFQNFVMSPVMIASYLITSNQNKWNQKVHDPTK